MRNVRRTLSLLAAVGLLGLTATCADFDQILDTTDEVLFTVRIEQATPWPTQIRLGETVELSVQVRDQGSQQLIANAQGMQISWRSDDPTLTLSQSTGPTNSATGVQTGTATPTVTVSGGPVQQTSYSEHTFTIVTAGVAIVEPGDTTLDALGDTLTFVAQGLDVDGVGADGTGVEWRRGSGPAAVQLLNTTGDTARVAVVAPGTDSVYASVPQCQAASPLSCEVGVEVVVAPVAVAMNATQDTFRIGAIGDATTVDVEFFDRNNFPFTGIASTFSLVDLADTLIIALDGATGQATALSSGDAEVAISNTVGDDTAVVKVYQLVSATGLDTTSILLEGIGASDSLFLAPTDANGNALQRVPAVTWSSSNEAIVAVTPNLADSLRAELLLSSFGDAWIYADVEGVVDSVMVTATGVVASVTVSPPEVTITQLTSRPALTVAAFDSLGNQIPNAPFTWESADETIVTVAQDPGDPARATLTPVQNGSAYVRALSGSFVDSALVTIDVVTAFSCDAGGGTVHDAGGGTLFLTASETWAKDGSPHYVQNGNITFDGVGVVLTIEAGALVCVDYGDIRFQNGARLQAVGTAAERILFTATTAANGDRWSSMYFDGTPGDTSRLEHVVVENLWGFIAANDPHPLAIQNALIAQTGGGVELYSRGSRISDSRVEGSDGSGVLLSNGTRAENSVISGTGWHGLQTWNWQDTVAIVNITVQNAGNAQVQVPAETPPAVNLYDARFSEVTPVTVTGSKLPFGGTIDAFVRMYPTTTDMDNLIGNINDEVQLRCGYIDENEAGDPSAVTFRGDLDWRIICGIAFGGTTTLTIEPGATVRFVTDDNYTGFNERDIEFYNESRLVAQGTETEPITFTSLERGGEWNRLYFEGPFQQAADTTFFKHVLIEHARNGIDVDGGAHIVMDSSRLRMIGQRALWLGGYSGSNPGTHARITNTTIDTVRTDPNDGSAAVNIWTNTLIENVTIRGAAGRGLRHWDNGPGGEGPRLRNVTIEGAQGIGLVAQWDTVSEATGITVSGGASYPAWLNMHTMAAVAPTAALQANLTGNAMDTVLVGRGSSAGNGFKGEVDLFGNFSALDTVVVSATLPWRVTTSSPVVDSAAVLLLEPNAHIAFEEGRGFEFRAGLLRSTATSAEPAVLTAVDPTAPWGSLRFYDDPRDTSYVRNVVLEYGGNNAYWPYVAVRSAGTHPVVIDSTTIRQTHGRAVEFYASGSRLTTAVIDTTLNADWPGAVRFSADTTGADGLTIRTPAYNGIYVDQDSVWLRNVRVEGALGDYGIEATNGTFSDISNVRVTGGANYPAWLSIENLQLMEQDSLLGNAKDTLVVAGGRAQGETDIFGNPTVIDTLVVRAAVPWKINGWITFDTASVFMPEPGATVALTDGVRLYFEEGRLVAQGTATDSITFTAANPLEPWSGFYFTGTAPDTSVLQYVNVDLAASNCCWPYASIYADGSHPVTVEDTRIWRSQNRALDLTARGTRVQNVVVDTTFGSSGNNGSAVELGQALSVDSLVIRKPFGYAAGVDGRSGLYIKGDSVDLSRVRIEDATGMGLWARDYDLGQVSGLRITGSGSYPLGVSVDNLWRIAPTAADQDSLLGNVKDTLVVDGGQIRGEIDAFGNPTRFDTVTVRADVPWFVKWGFTLDSASVLLVQPGATMTFEENVRLDFNSGQLLAQGTADSVIVMKPVSPQNQWTGLYFQGTPADTSRVRHVLIADAASTSSWPYAAIYTDGQHPVVVDSTTIKRAEGRFADLRAPGTRFLDVLADTAANTAWTGRAGIEVYDSVTLENVTIRGTSHEGLGIYGSGSTLNGVLVDGAGLSDNTRAGLYIQDGATLASVSGVRITGGRSYPADIPVYAAKWFEPDSLLGNTRDTLKVRTGTLTSDTARVTTGIPWLVPDFSSFTISTDAQLIVDPGAALAFGDDAYIDFNGGTLDAQGDAANPVYFGPQGSATIWWGLRFFGTPPDTSRLRHARVSYAGDGPFDDWAVYAFGSHPVVIDSSVVRQSANGAVRLSSTGSRMQYSVVDTVNAGYGLQLDGSSTSVRGSLVRRAVNGINILSGTVTVDSTEVNGSTASGIEVSVDPTSLSIHNNNFIGNTGAAVVNNHATINLDATNNWWDNGGAGPTQDAANGYSSAGGGVTVNPWLSAAVVIPWYKPGG